jgi:hypothetical protein
VLNRDTGHAGEYDAEKTRTVHRCTARAFLAVLLAVPGSSWQFARFVITAQIACRAATLGSTTGQHREVQILVDLPDVVLPALSRQPFSAPVHRWCIRQAESPATATTMDTRQLPTQEVVIRNGQPVWRVCGAGMCVEDASGIRAMSAYRALCSSHGIEPPCTDLSLPCRGPSECDEPGV